MRMRRDEPPGALVELGYRLRYLGPVEIVRQVAARWRPSSRFGKPAARNDGERPLFEGISPYEITPEQVYDAEACARADTELRAQLVAQAARISELEAQLARSRELLSEAHSLVLTLRARIARRRAAARTTA
jgi:hypothetical protein